MKPARTYPNSARGVTQVYDTREAKQGDMMFKHILFDADNTLFDFDLMERSAFFETLRAFAVPCDDALYRRYREANRLLWLEFEQGRADKELALEQR